MKISRFSGYGFPAILIIILLLTAACARSGKEGTCTGSNLSETGRLGGAALPEASASPGSAAAESAPADETRDAPCGQTDAEAAGTLPEGASEEPTPDTAPESILEEAAAGTLPEGASEEPGSDTAPESAPEEAAAGTLPEGASEEPPPDTAPESAPEAASSAAPSAASSAAAHRHSFSALLTKAATCGEEGIMTYTCGCGERRTESIPATRDHVWEEQFKIVRHDAVTHIVHHDAVTHTIHHEAVTHEEWVTDRPAYDEAVTETHDICNGCGADLTVMYQENGSDDAVYFEHGSCFFPSWHTEQVVISVIHHEEQGHYETVVDLPAFDETVVDREAFDEIVVDREAFEETVPDGFKCAVCGAQKNTNSIP